MIKFISSQFQVALPKLRIGGESPTGTGHWQVIVDDYRPPVEGPKVADSARLTNALEADIREDCDELADGRSGRSAFLSDIKPSDQRCVTRVGRLCDLTGKLSLSTEGAIKSEVQHLPRVRCAHAKKKNVSTA